VDADEPELAAFLSVEAIEVPDFVGGPRSVATP
jgi:hypothetical protein